MTATKHAYHQQGPQAVARRKRENHLISSVRYQGTDPGDGSYPLAPVTCSCSWTGVLKEFQAHRRWHGMRNTGR